ncbi:MAG: adenylyl-sulfate kinase [Alistipes sp.]|nr:adenylyl-sulfate kinase [Alistipes sp.]
MDNIYPIFDRMQSREQKERQLRQRGVTLWFTGLSGSGKSTVAIALEHRLSRQGYIVQILDGDNIRSGISSDLTFSAADREQNIRRVAHISRLYNHTGIITLCCLLSPTQQLRNMARQIIGSSDFIEVYISTPLSVCEQRDIKGLYAQARRGEIADFTGISAPFEPPQSAQITIDTTQRSAESCAEHIYNSIRERIKGGFIN